MTYTSGVFAVTLADWGAYHVTAAYAAVGIGAGERAWVRLTYVRDEGMSGRGYRLANDLILHLDPARDCLELHALLAEGPTLVHRWDRPG